MKRGKAGTWSIKQAATVFFFVALLLQTHSASSRASYFEGSNTRHLFMIKQIKNFSKHNCNEKKPSSAHRLPMIHHSPDGKSIEQHSSIKLSSDYNIFMSQLLRDSKHFILIFISSKALYVVIFIFTKFELRRSTVLIYSKRFISEQLLSGMVQLVYYF